MKGQISQYCLRMSRSDYLQALDLAFVFGLSMNQFLVGAIREFVKSRLEEEATLCAVKKVREVREAGLSIASVAELAPGSIGTAGSRSTDPLEGGLACELEAVTLSEFTKRRA